MLSATAVAGGPYHVKSLHFKIYFNHSLAPYPVELPGCWRGHNLLLLLLLAMPCKAHYLVIISEFPSLTRLSGGYEIFVFYFFTISNFKYVNCRTFLGKKKLPVRPEAAFRYLSFQSVRVCVHTHFFFPKIMAIISCKLFCNVLFQLTYNLLLSKSLNLHPQHYMKLISSIPL